MDEKKNAFLLILDIVSKQMLQRLSLSAVVYNITLYANDIFDHIKRDRYNTNMELIINKDKTIIEDNNRRDHILVHQDKEFHIELKS